MSFCQESPFFKGPESRFPLSNGQSEEKKQKKKHRKWRRAEHTEEGDADALQTETAAARIKVIFSSGCGDLIQNLAELMWTYPYPPTPSLSLDPYGKCPFLFFSLLVTTFPHVPSKRKGKQE